MHSLQSKSNILFIYYKHFNVQQCQSAYVNWAKWSKRIWGTETNLRHGYLYIQHIEKLCLHNLVFANGSSRPWPFVLKLHSYMFFFEGSMLCKQWVGLRAAWNRCLSQCSIKLAEFEVCDVSCHLWTLLNTASTLCRSSAESWLASAGNGYWNLATARAVNTRVSRWHWVPVCAADLKDINAGSVY